MTVATNNDRFIHVESGTYPLYLYQIPAHNPQLSLPVDVTIEALFNAGYSLVNPVEPPVGDVVTEGTPVEADGVYTQVWEVRAFTPEELQAHFETKKADAETQVNQLFFVAQDTGAEVTIDGVAGAQHFGLSEIQRTDYAAMKARAGRTAPSTLLTLRSKEGVNIKLVPARMIALCEALEDFFYDLQLGYYDLLDQVSLAEALEELPELPAAITADPRVIA